jgi:hypothetical protein
MNDRQKNYARAALPVLAMLMPLLGGCTAAIAPVTLASVVTMGRTPADAVISVASGHDCSIIRMGLGQSYCKPTEAPPTPPTYCTRSLGVVDCWDKPNPFGYYQRGVADGPTMLTADQESNRTAWWPDH